MTCKIFLSLFFFFFFLEKFFPFPLHTHVASINNYYGILRWLVSAKREKSASRCWNIRYMMNRNWQRYVLKRKNNGKRGMRFVDGLAGSGQLFCRGASPHAVFGFTSLMLWSRRKWNGFYVLCRKQLLMSNNFFFLTFPNNGKISSRRSHTRSGFVLKYGG
jgi:hypothetical protein